MLRSSGAELPPILVVEADASLRRLLEVTLRPIGSVVVAASRAEAEAMLVSSNPAAAVTHLGLAYLGYDWVDALIAGGVPTVVLTGMTEPSRLRPINPAARVLTKPFKPDELQSLVTSMLVDSAGP